MTDTTLDQLSAETCIDLLRMHSIGRISVIVDGFPVVLPVNYRFVESRTGPLILIRTRPGNVIDQTGVKRSIRDRQHRFEPLHRVVSTRCARKGLVNDRYSGSPGRRRI